MKLKKLVLSIIIISVAIMLIPVETFALYERIYYNAISFCISIVMNLLAVILGIAYFIFAIVYLIKTKKQKTINQQMKKLIIWLIITVIIIIMLIHFAPIVRQIGMTFSAGGSQELNLLIPSK